MEALRLRPAVGSRLRIVRKILNICMLLCRYLLYKGGSQSGKPLKMTLNALDEEGSVF